MKSKDMEGSSRLQKPNRAWILYILRDHIPEKPRLFVDC